MAENAQGKHGQKMQEGTTGITHSKTTVEPLHNGHLGDSGKWPLRRGGRYGEVGV